MLSKDIIEKVIDLYLQGWSTRQIADAMGISKSVVGTIVKKSELGRDKSTSQILGCKRTTRIPFMWSFFPLTPEKTWLLGLIYGDGSLCNDGYKITITSGDFDVIDNINHLFGDRLGIFITYINLSNYRVTFETPLERTQWKLCACSQ